MTPRTILVTGGVGFLGSALVRRLVRDGHRVRVLDDRSRGSLDRLSDLTGSFEFVPGDVRDAEAVRRSARGVEAVCHLAAVNGTANFYRDPALVLDVGVRGTLHVLDACRAEGVGELFLASSSEVYHVAPRTPTDETVPLTIPDPLNPRFSYSAGKILGEMMVLHAGAGGPGRVAVVRPHNVYGPDMGGEHVIPQFVLRMRRCVRGASGRVPFPIEGTGEETRAFLWVDDFIDGWMAVMERGEHRGIYHVGTSEEIAIAELARQVAAYFGATIEIVPGTRREGSPPRRCPDIARARALGFAPRMAFAEGLRRTAEWYDRNAERFGAAAAETGRTGA